MNNLEKVMFSALLHDIGKVVQRAENSIENHSIQGVTFLKTFNNNILNDKELLEAIQYHHAADLKKQILIVLTLLILSMKQII